MRKIIMVGMLAALALLAGPMAVHAQGHGHHQRMHQQMDRMVQQMGQMHGQLEAMESQIQRHMQGQLSDQQMQRYRHLHQVASSMRGMASQMQTAMTQVREMVGDSAIHEDPAMQQDLDRLREHMQGMMDQMGAGLEAMERLRERASGSGGPR